MIDIALKHIFSNHTNVLSRTFVTESKSQTSSFLSAISYRCDDLIAKLGISKNESKAFFQLACQATQVAYLKNPEKFKASDNELSLKVKDAIQTYLVSKAETPNRMMYSEEYKQLFLPESSVTQLQIEMLLGKKYEPRGFKRLESNTCEFELLENANPSDSLEAFIEGPTICDCGSAVETVFFKTLRSETKKDHFDALFSKPDLRLRITHNGPIDKQSLINLFTKHCFQYQFGARCYFHGHPNYTKKHGNGIGLGLHAIMTDDQTPSFWGLGLDSLKSKKDIETYLLSQYTKDPGENLLLSFKDKYQFEEDKDITERTKVGLCGLEYVDTLSSEIVDFINRSTIDEIKDPKFKDRLIVRNLAVQIKQILHSYKLNII